MNNINEELYKIKQLEDISLGDIGENDIFSIIEKLLLVKIKKTNDKYSIMDFIDSDGNYYEIKTRRSKYNQYPTTMVGENKIKFCKNTDKKCFFFFRFSDGVYYWVYNPYDLLQFGKGGRCDRGYDEYKQYCYIPIRYLKKVN